MTRTVMRYVTWRLFPNTEPDTEPGLHSMECTTCGERGPALEDPEAARQWVFDHVRDRQHHLHMTYREHITRPWTAMPTDTPPHGDLDDEWTDQ